jgi:hypothetical protein
MATGLEIYLRYRCPGNAWPMKCLPNEMRSLFHRGEAYFYGVYLCPEIYQKKDKKILTLGSFHSII